MVAAQQAPSKGLSRGQLWTLVVSCLSVSLVVAAMAALYTALPQVAVETGASQTQLTWMVDGYTLALACLVLPSGAIGDRFGRRNVLVIGLAIFSVASGAPLLSHEPVLLIASRALAGVGAALVMPSTLSILTAGFPEERRARAVAIWAGVTGAGGILGILGSGLLLQRWSWLSIFVGLTAAGAVLLALAFTVPESRDEQRPRLDPAGSAWSALAISATVLALIEGPTRGWHSALVLAAFAVGAICAVQFVRVELRAAHPMLDVRYFARRGFGSGTLSIAIQFLVSFGLFLLVMQWVQLVLGFSAVKSAFALAPIAVPMLLLSLVAPWLATRLGLRVMTVVGLVAVAVGMYLFSRLHVSSTYVDSIGPMLALSAGLGLCAAPATAAIVAETPSRKHGVAAAVNDTAREIGAAIGIAIAGSVLAAAYSQRIQPALAHLPPVARRPVSDSLAAALKVADRAGPQGSRLADFAKAAFMTGVDRAALVLAIVCLVGAVVIGLWAPGHTATVTSRERQPAHRQAAREPAGTAPRERLRHAASLVLRRRRSVTHTTAPH